MHPRIQEVLSVIDEARAALKKTVGAVPTALHSVRPGTDRWSIAEVLEHLGMVETRIAHMLTEKIHAARDAGLAVESDLSPVAPMLDLTGVISRSNPLTASEASQPRGGLTSDEGMKILDERRQQLRDTITSVDGLALGTVEVPHARLGNLNVYQWLLFLAGHEARHTDQIREAGAEVQRTT